MIWEVMLVMPNDRFTYTEGDLKISISQCKNCIFRKGDLECSVYGKVSLNIACNKTICLKKQPKGTIIEEDKA